MSEQSGEEGALEELTKWVTEWKIGRKNDLGDDYITSFLIFSRVPLCGNNLRKNNEIWSKLPWLGFGLLGNAFWVMKKPTETWLPGSRAGVGLPACQTIFPPALSPRTEPNTRSIGTCPISFSTTEFSASLPNSLCGEESFSLTLCWILWLLLRIRIILFSTISFFRQKFVLFFSSF